MKRIIRIILSPFLFLLIFFGLIIIPFGPFCLLGGLTMKFYYWITDKNYISDNPKWWLVFVWIVGPWYETNRFIRGEKL